MVFEAALESANWDEASSTWIVETSAGITFRTRYLVTALGILSKRNVPDIAGLSSFGGEKFHTAAWPENASLQGKRVGVIGNGSSGVQVVTAIGKKEEVKHLISCTLFPHEKLLCGRILT
jgi:cation diffusion facilitator CzcD-associated flavoprotein CzcO